MSRKPDMPDLLNAIRDNATACDLRVAFCGASGTGKTALASFVRTRFDLLENPVGSRSVAKAMGFASPYEVDEQGCRAEFQDRLLSDKCIWEREHDEFVTDRTVLDNLAYHAVHDVRSVTWGQLTRAAAGMTRYTHVFWCPVDSFFDPGEDPARLTDPAYHILYESMLRGLFARMRVMYYRIEERDLAARKALVERVLNHRNDGFTLAGEVGR